MAKLTKEQSVKFDQLYTTTLNWGVDENCIGLFECFGKNLQNLATCVNEDEGLEILKANCSRGSYVVEDVLPINSKTKNRLKIIVEHLMDDNSDFKTLSKVKY